MQYFVINIYNYRPEHAGVSLLQRKLQVHQSYQLLGSAVLMDAVYVHGMGVNRSLYWTYCSYNTECSVAS